MPNSHPQPRQSKVDCAVKDIQRAQRQIKKAQETTEQVNLSSLHSVYVDRNTRDEAFARDELYRWFRSRRADIATKQDGFIVVAEEQTSITTPNQSTNPNALFAPQQGLMASVASAVTAPFRW